MLPKTAMLSEEHFFSFFCSWITTLVVVCLTCMYCTAVSVWTNLSSYSISCLIIESFISFNLVVISFYIYCNNIVDKKDLFKIMFCTTGNNMAWWLQQIPCWSEGPGSHGSEFDILCFWDNNHCSGRCRNYGYIPAFVIKRGKTVLKIFI